MLNTDETISRLQSSTVQSALKLVVINIAVLVVTFTGITMDIEAIKSMTETWLPLGINVLSAYWGYKAITGRVSATSTIQPLPWREEIASIKKDK